MNTPPTKTVESITVEAFYSRAKDALGLEVVAGQDRMERRIGEKSINRPALALTGYFKYFAHRRLQLFGAGEMAYLRDQPTEQQREIMAAVLERNVPCVVVSRGLQPTTALREACQKHGVPLIRTHQKSKDFSAEATLLLEELFAPRTTLHGTLLDIKGIGVLLRGKSGVGKSECALTLIERGHSLVADDLVHARRVDDTEVVGQGPELNRGFMECRGIGIINVAKLFGVRSLRLSKRIDLILTFVEWTPGMIEERTGLERQTIPVLDVDISHMELPVKPGRDMARLAEVASLVHALRQMGHDSAAELNERLIAQMTSAPLKG
ncbi:MAG: HPr(Ser) kinase/phosphatase [Opitutales bacterium]